MKTTFPSYISEVNDQSLELSDGYFLTCGSNIYMTTQQISIFCFVRQHSLNLEKVSKTFTDISPITFCVQLGSPGLLHDDQIQN